MNRFRMGLVAGLLSWGLCSLKRDWSARLNSNILR